MSKAEIIRTGLELGVDYAHDGVVLSGETPKARVRPLRLLPIARSRLRGSRGAGPDALRLSGRSELILAEARLRRHAWRQVRLSFAPPWDGSSVGRARPF